jgi:hypothetical protein
MIAWIHIELVFDTYGEWDLNPVDFINILEKNTSSKC